MRPPYANASPSAFSNRNALRIQQFRLLLRRLRRFAMPNRSCMFLFRCKRWGFDNSKFRQSEFLAQLGFEFGHGVLIFFHELFGALASLATAFSSVAEPSAGFFQDFFGYGQVNHVTLAGNAFAVHDVELRLAEWRSGLVLDDLHFGTVTSHHIAILHRPDPANATAYARPILHPAPTSLSFHIPTHHAT